MIRGISKLILSVFVTFLVFVSVVSIPTISYSKDIAPAESISLKSGWSPCNDKGEEIAAAFTYNDPSKINVRPVWYITNGETILNIDKEKDVSVDYLWNDSAGKAYAFIRGIGKYKDEFIFEFSISADPNIAEAEMTSDHTKISMENVDVSISQETRIYTGNPYEPLPLVKYEDQDLIKDIDYTVSWMNNISAGTATISVTGIRDYEGTREITFEIADPSDKNSNKKENERSDKQEVDKTSTIILYQGQTKQLLGKVEAFNIDITDSVQWTSSDNEVATIDGSGVVTAVGGGKASIMMQATDGSERNGRCTVIVKTGYDIVKEAHKVLGVKYVWGGSSLTDGMDCSGLVVAVYREVLGVKLPHFTGDLEKSDKFRTIDVSELQPGDILVRYGPGYKSGKHIRHAGIWTGTGIIEESGGDGKCIESDKTSKVDHWLANYTPRRYVG